MKMTMHDSLTISNMKERERKSEWLNKWEKKWIVYVIVFKCEKRLKRVQQKETGAECDWKIELRWKENV